MDRPSDRVVKMHVLLGNANPAEYVDGDPYEEEILDLDGTPTGQFKTVIPRIKRAVDIGETITRFGPFPEEGWTLLEKVGAITNDRGGWQGHSLDDTPEWIASDNDAMLLLLGEHWPNAERVPWGEAVARYEEKGGVL
jgi:hypothetical protein